MNKTRKSFIKILMITMILAITFLNIDFVLATTEDDAHIDEVTGSDAQSGTGGTNDYDPTLDEGVSRYTVSQTTYLVLKWGDNDYRGYSFQATEDTFPMTYELDTYKTGNYKEDFKDVSTDPKDYIDYENYIAESIGKEVYGRFYNGSDEQVEEISRMIYEAQKDGKTAIVNRDLDMPTTGKGVYIVQNKEPIDFNAGKDLNGESLDLRYVYNKQKGEWEPSEHLAYILANPNAKIMNKAGQTVIGVTALHDMVDRLGKTPQNIIYDLSKYDVEDTYPEEEDPKEPEPPAVLISSSLKISPNSCGWQNEACEVSVSCNPTQETTGFQYDQMNCTCHSYPRCGTCGGTGSITCPRCGGSYLEIPYSYNPGCGYYCSRACTMSHEHTDNCPKACTTDHTVSGTYVCSTTVGCPAYIAPHNCPRGGTQYWRWNGQNTIQYAAKEGRHKETFTLYYNLEKNSPEPGTPGKTNFRNMIKPLYSKSITSTGYYCIDYTSPRVTVNISYSGWTNTPVSFFASADDSKPTVNAVSGVASITPSSGQVTTEGVSSVTATAYDNAGNSGSGTSGAIRIDYTAPVIAYRVENNNLIYNTKIKEVYEGVTKIGRWESTDVEPTDSIKPYFLLKVVDPLPSGVNQNSGLGRVYYQIYNDTTHLYDEDKIYNNSISLTSTNISLLNTGKYRIDIPQDILLEGGNIYLAVLAQDNAGNKATTKKGHLGNDANGDKIVPDNLQMINKTSHAKFIEGHIFVNTIYNEVPTLPVPDPSEPLLSQYNSALHVTNVNDVKWKSTITKEVPTQDMALYMNEMNDTIGLGYAVGFKYNLKGFGLEDGDKVILKASLYGKIGNTYKKINKIKVNGKFTDEYFTREMVRNAKTLNNNITKASELLTDGYAYKVETKNTNVSLYFNYYIPANAVLYYTESGTDKEYKGEQIVVVFDLESYKWYDVTTKKFVHTYSKDTRVKWNTTQGISKTTSYNGTKRIENIINVGQVFWYDLVNTAVKDISGERN